MKIASASQLTSLPQIRQATSKIASTYSQVALQSRQAEVFITTKEGDKVSISNNFFSQQKIGAQGYDNGQELLTAQATTGKSEFLQVQGDLSPQELVDLGKLLDDLSQIAGDFFNCNLEGAAAGAMNLGDMGSLAKLDASFTNTWSSARASTDYHPLPASTADLFSNLLAHDEEKPPARNELSVSDRLQAQWQQFRSYMENQTGEDQTSGSRTETATQSDSPAKSTDLKDPGQAMLARVRSTLQGHPRLSPLVPAVSDLALHKVRFAMPYQPAGHNFIKEARHNFKDAFRGWMM